MSPEVLALVVGVVVGGFLSAWVLVLVTLVRLTRGQGGDK